MLKIFTSIAMNVLRGVGVMLGIVIFLITLNMVIQKAHEKSDKISTVRVGNTTVLVDVSADEASREQGLSGRLALVPNTGMLFVFDQDGLWGIWMKDMKFSIDIIWADSSGRILTIAQNVSPDTYPNPFYPISPARYVLEVPAGFASAHGIKEGNVMDMSIAVKKI